MEKVADNPNSTLREKLLRELLAEEEFRLMVKEAKKTARIGMFGKGRVEDFLRQRLRCINSDFH